MVEIVFILDRSGSMEGLEKDTIGGFNSMIEEQKSKPGKALVSTVLFDDKVSVIHDRIPLENVPRLTEREYFVRGCTALLDAVGGAINHIGNIHKYAREEDIPSETIFVITTDGLENASRNYTYGKIKEMINRQKEMYGWEFIFLGANMDAAAEAERFGIDSNRAASYNNDRVGTALNYEVIGETITTLRFEAKIEDGWKTAIDRDYHTRERHK